MIIDFHTHVFPDKIAKRTIELLAEKGGNPPFSDGSVNGLLCEMEKAGADISVTLPVMTNPAQFDSITHFAAEINERFKNEARRLISCAGIHPDCEEIDKKMSFIKESGFLGVKIHPDYQSTFFSDERYIRILECAKEYDLIVVTHAGVDGAYRDMPVRCTPEMVKEVTRKVGHSKLVLAHLGANEMAKEVYDLLCGEDVYFDTAYVLRFTPAEDFERIVKKHGEDRILFASDSPWSSIKNDADILRSFALGKEAEKKIFYKNAEKLLGI